MEEKIFQLAQVLWNYHQMNHSIEKSDLILVLGSNDIRVAEYGAQLFLEGYAPKILFSGRFGNFTEGNWDEPEAQKFARIAIDAGVPRDCILIEDKSTNSGENIRYSYELLTSVNLAPKSVLLIQKPFMERRAYATFKQQWSDKTATVILSSPQISFENYPNKVLSFETVVHTMVGDMQRIVEYPKKGYQIAQEIPQDVHNAYNNLIQFGFTQYLID